MNFHCSYCGHRIEVVGASFGSTVTCGSCNAETLVPPPSRSGPAPVPAQEGAVSTPGVQKTRRYRAFFLLMLLCGLGLGAMTAILALLTFELGAVQAKILMSALSLGVYSVTGLCCAALVDRGRYQALGGLGVGASIGGAAFAIATTWAGGAGWPVLVQFRAAIFVVALALTHAAVLLLLETTHVAVRLCRQATIGVAVAVAVLLLISIVDPEFLVDGWVALGILGVLGSLGTIATPLLHFATRPPRGG